MTPERTLNGKAVLIGALVSFVGFLLTSIVFVFLAAWVLTLGGVARDDIQARVGHDPAFLFAYLLLGSGFTALGGLIAARIAGPGVAPRRRHGGTALSLRCSLLHDGGDEAFFSGLHHPHVGAHPRECRARRLFGAPDRPRCAPV